MNEQPVPEENTTLNDLRKMIGSPAPKDISAVFNWLNPTLMAADAGQVQFNYTVSEQWLNPMRTLHGGIMATLIDDAIGVAVYSLGLPVYYTTINLSVDYFVPVNAGDELRATAEVVKEGKQIVHAICEVRKVVNNKVVARATSNLMKTSALK